MRLLVLDASETVPWCFEDEANPESEAILQALKTNAFAIVPSMWRIEVANALLIAERKKRINVQQTEVFMNDLLRLNVAIDRVAGTATWKRIVGLGRENGLTAYDASYLELAIRMDVPIATKDAKLIQAATTCGVSLFQL